MQTRFFVIDLILPIWEAKGKPNEQITYTNTKKKYFGKLIVQGTCNLQKQLNIQLAKIIKFNIPKKFSWSHMADFIAVWGLR